MTVRTWTDVKENLTSVTQEDWNEIDFQVRLVGENLDTRREKGLTQAELDALCGVNQTHITPG